MWGIKNAVREALREEWSGLIGAAWQSGFSAREPMIAEITRDSDSARAYATTIADENVALKDMLTELREQHEQAMNIVRAALYMRMYGEQAPGYGPLENWRSWDQAATDIVYPLSKDDNVRNDGENGPADDGNSSRPLGQGGIDNSLDTIPQRVISSKD